jgi:hypothetical protein
MHKSKVKAQIDFLPQKKWAYEWEWEKGTEICIIKNGRVEREGKMRRNTKKRVIGNRGIE